MKAKVAKAKVTDNVLIDSGLIDAYDCKKYDSLMKLHFVSLDFLRQLCKNGLPSGNIFEYAAQEVMKFEKKKMTGPYKKGLQKIGKIVSID